MIKLQWSPQGFLRKMQISQIPLFAFVEGFQDRYFYSEVLRRECTQHNIEYQLVTAAEVEQHTGGGGKATLLKFFDFLQQNTKLKHRFHGRLTVAIFFLDKDVDDIRGTMRLSDHIVYTEQYDLEGHLFLHGRLAQAAASSAALDITLVKEYLTDSETWLAEAARSWQIWVVLCVFGAIYSTSSRYYSRPKSQINHGGVYGPVDVNQLKQHCATMQRETGMSADGFRYRLQWISDKISLLYSGRQYGTVFKGKWYFEFLEEDLKKLAAGNQFDSHSLKRRVRTALEQTLDIDERWAYHFREPVRRILDQLT